MNDQGHRDCPVAESGEFGAALRRGRRQVLAGAGGEVYSGLFDDLAIGEDPRAVQGSVGAPETLLGESSAVDTLEAATDLVLEREQLIAYGLETCAVHWRVAQDHPPARLRVSAGV